MSRNRSCDNPPPQYGGKICTGNTTGDPQDKSRNEKQYPGESLAFQKLLLALEIFVAQETQNILGVSKHPHCLK